LPPPQSKEKIKTAHLPKEKREPVPLARITEQTHIPIKLLGWLCAQWQEIDGMYSSFTIKKASGKTREIRAPEFPLKYIQRQIYDNILAPVKLHPACHGFCKGRSTITNAYAHTAKEVVINIDLQDFFPSISAGRVYGIFKSLGYDTAECGLLTRITTLDGVLPQGAPTSPALANLTCRRLDSRLSGLAKRTEASYSRYADDITFSGNGNIISLLPLIRRIIEGEGFNIAEEKKRITRQGNRQEVTGLTVNEEVSIPRKRRRLLRAAMHNLKNDKKVHWQGVDLDLDSLKGHIAYLKSLHPELAKIYLNQISQ